MDSSLNLALIQWYDFKSLNHSYLHEYSHIELKDLYNFVAIEAIQDVIHVVPRFGKTNEYFVNKFLF